MKTSAQVCFVLLTAIVPLHAQESLFQSSDGQTSIFLSSSPSGGVIEDGKSNHGVALYNVSSSTGEFGYLHQGSVEPVGYGFDIRGTLKQGTAGIIHNNATAPGVSLRAAVSKNLLKLDARNVPKPLPGQPGVSTYECVLCGEWIVVQGRFDTSQFYTVPTSASPFPTPTKQTFNAFQGVVAYNALLKSSNADWLLGATLGVGVLNNTNSLKSSQYTNNQLTVIGGAQEIIGQGSQTLYIGNYRTFTGVPINADAIVFPGVFSGMVGIDLFVRSDVASADRFGSPGLGLFISKPGQPARPVGGITGSYKNGTAQVSLLVGWSF